MDKRAKNNAEVRKRNNHLVYQSVYNAQDPITKRALVENLGLSLPTVTSCLNYLIKNKLLKYGGVEASTGGRKACTVKLVPNSRLSLGLAISANNVVFTAVNVLADVVAYQKILINFEDVDSYYEFLSYKLEQFVDSNKLNRNDILGVGISLPGIINKNNILELAPTLGVKNKNVDEISRYFNFDTFFINDANAGGFAEWWIKPLERNISYLLVDQGVGGAILIDNKAYYGDNFRSCEFGHLCIAPDGNMCSCGKSGCLEAMCSIDRISTDLGVSLEEFFDECAKDNKKYLEILNQYLFYLAKGIVAIRVIMDNTIIIGGQIAPFLPPYIAKLQNLANELFPFNNNESFIKLCQIGAKSASVGAALIWIDKFIKKIK
ncbi:MAG: ROK family protein [Christensenellaceae bacterium]|nr:ROK family protein [Christensenellaceae bacterium]